MRFFLIVLMLALLLGCSRIKFAYHQLDWLLPYYLETYIELSDEQSSYLKEQVKMMLAWHCAMQLANYAELFREANADFQKGQMSRERLDYFAGKIEHFWFDLMRQVSPVLTQLLLTATDQQLAVLFDSLEEKNQEWLAEFKQQSDAEIEEEYMQHMSDVLERWFGPLQEVQLQAVREWVKQFRPLGMEGLQMRRNWQSRLRELTTRRDKVAAFKSGINELLFRPELLHSSTYQKKLDNNQITTIDLLFIIGKQLNKSQHKHLAAETLAIAQEFDDLACIRVDTVSQETDKVVTYWH